MVHWPLPGKNKTNTKKSVTLHRFLNIKKAEFIQTQLTYPPNGQISWLS